MFSCYFCSDVHADGDVAGQPVSHTARIALRRRQGSASPPPRPVPTTLPIQGRCLTAASPSCHVTSGSSRQLSVFVLGGGLLWLLCGLLCGCKLSRHLSSIFNFVCAVMAVILHCVFFFFSFFVRAFIAVVVVFPVVVFVVVLTMCE